MSTKTVNTIRRAMYGKLRIYQFLPGLEPILIYCTSTVVAIYLTKTESRTLNVKHSFVNIPLKLGAQF